MKKPALIGIFIMAVVLVGNGLAAQQAAQKLRPPRDMDRLASRAQQYWGALTRGQRSGAAEYILARDRSRFLDAPSTRVLSAEVHGIEFGSDPARALVRVRLKFLLPGAAGAPDEIQATNDWIWSNNNWYLEYPIPANLFASAASTPPKLEIVLAEFRSKLRFPSTSFETGTIPQGNRQRITIPVEYNGEVPVGFAAKFGSAIVRLDPNSPPVLTRQTKSIGIEVGSPDSDGTFSEPLVLTFWYNGVEHDQIFTFTGKIDAPFSFEQTPAILEPGFDGEIVLSMRNNTDQDVTVENVTSEGFFRLIQAPKALAPGERASIVLRRQGGAEERLPKISIGIKPSIADRDLFEYRLRVRGL